LFNLQSTAAPDQKKLRGAGYKFATNHSIARIRPVHPEVVVMERGLQSAGT